MISNIYTKEIQSTLKENKGKNDDDGDEYIYELNKCKRKTKELNVVYSEIFIKEDNIN